ncbi:MAG: hypothetical protein ACW99F_11335, partial [Candidatus Hodarchaeales archaeon]
NLSLQLGKDIPPSVRGRVFSGFSSFLFLGQFFSPIVSQFLLRFVSISELFFIGGGVMMTITLLISMKHYMVPNQREEILTRSID